MIWSFQAVLRPLQSQFHKYKRKPEDDTARTNSLVCVEGGKLIDSESLYDAFRALGGNRNVRGRAAKAEWVVVPHTLFC